MEKDEKAKSQKCMEKGKLWILGLVETTGIFLIHTFHTIYKTNFMVAFHSLTWSDSVLHGVTQCQISNGQCHH